MTKVLSGAFVTLHGSRGSFGKRINIAVWSTLEALHKPRRRSWLSSNIRMRTELANESVLLIARYLKEIAELQFEVPENTSIINFDLGSTINTRIAVAIFIVVSGYGLIDLVYNTEDYLLAPPETEFFVIGGVTMLVALIFLVRNNIPRMVSIGLSLMLGWAGYFASYAGILRINQFFDDTGLRNHTYVISDHNTLNPVESGLPEFGVDSAAFWKQPPGTRITVSIRKGGLGLYQMDKEVIYGQMRHWYCIQRNIAHPGHTENCDNS